MLRPASVSAAAATLRNAVAARGLATSRAVSNGYNYFPKDKGTPTSWAHTGYVDPDPQNGDYPNVPMISINHKSPYGWDDVQDRRNFGDVVPEHDHVLNKWGPGTEDLRINRWTALFQFGIFGAIVATLGTIVYFNQRTPHVVPRTFPYDGLRLEYGADPKDDELKVAKARAAGSV